MADYTGKNIRLSIFGVSIGGFSVSIRRIYESICN